MYVEEIKSRRKNKVYTTVLVRESYRCDGKVKHRTLANISKFPREHIEQIKRLFAGLTPGLEASELELGESREYGGSYALLELIKHLGLDRIIYSRPTPWRNRLLAQIVGRILYQGSKLSLTNLYNDTCLWELCGYAPGTRPAVQEACYAPLDKLLQQQPRIQKRLAQRHLTDGCLILYDMTNIWFEGEYAESEIVDYGLGKSGKRGYKQVAIGLLTDKRGCPVAVEVFNGRTSEQMTVKEQVDRLAKEYGVREIVFAGDRGMLTPKRIEEVNAAGYKTLTALTHPQIMDLLERRVIQLGLFDEKRIAEVVDPDKPSVRYMLCRNPETAERERRTRDDLIATASKGLEKIAAVKRRRRADMVSARVGRLLGQYKVGKFFNWRVDEDGRLEWSVDEELVQMEQSIDGCYVVRTDASAEVMNKQESVDGYKSLQHVEKAFRNFKTVLLEIRPVYHKTDDRIRAHVFLCMLAYYVQWHAIARLAELFENDGEQSGRRWTVQGVIERLKSIRKTKCFANGVYLFDRISIPDKEQARILSLLGAHISPGKSGSQ